jgi:hypothetical protein
MRATTVTVSAALCLALLDCSSGSGGPSNAGGSVGTGGGSGGRSSTGGMLGSGGAGSGGTTQAGGTTASGGAAAGGNSSGGSNVQGGGGTAGGGGSAGSGAGGDGGGSSVQGGAAGGGTAGGGGGGSAGKGAGGSTGGTSGSAGGNTGGAGSTGSGGTTGTGGSTGPVSHRFLKSGHTSQSVAIVAANGSIEWEYPITDETSDSWLLPNGNVVFSFVKGVREVTPTKATVWEYLVPSGAEAQSCQPLPNDQFLVGEAHGDGTSFLYEMGRDKKITKTITIKTTSTNAHDEFRQVRKTSDGTYLVTQQRTGGKAQEYDGTGKLLRTFPCGRYVAVRLPDGNTLIACGDDHRIIEVDPADKIVWEVKETDIAGNTLLFAAGLQRLPNGNTVISNWSGHTGNPTQPQVFEITRDKKVVWEVKSAKLNLISSIAILDPDAAVDGVLLR